MQTALPQLLNGLSTASVLYLVAVGLSLTYGIGKFLNLAHGAFYLLGAYLALELADGPGFWAALVIAPVAVGALAFALDRLLLTRYAGEHRAIEQLLLTFGLAFVMSDLMLMRFGGDILSLRAPSLLQGHVDLGIQSFPVYRLAVIATGVAVAVAITLVLRYTHAGVVIRTAAADADIAETVGIDPRRVLSLTFAAGAALAAFGGVVGAPVVATNSDRDFSTLILALVVVIVGGLGSVTATFWAAVVVGLVDGFGLAWAPSWSAYLVYVLLAAVLIARPQGLFVRAT